ncbi:unnamed protein product [Fusarium equiseti]|uniref:Carotenoid oxygenase n=1 Tax=Fusarium equiseti TaxID=61235 RepID=A0A8J2JDN8_FUSEQ|nr:unnamed protein product [Fusarium equiseti]
MAKDKSAGFGPPRDSDPLTWGFYATPEVQDRTDLVIEGTIPRWLTGFLYRGAAATWDVGNYTAEHWFDRFSRNHQFEIANGQVTYKSRNGSDELNDSVWETGLLPGGSFGGDPCKVIFGAFEVTSRDGNNTCGDDDGDSIQVSYVRNWPGLKVGHGKNLVSTTDSNKMQQINPDTLESIELFTYEASNSLLKSSGQSADHPAVTHDGAVFNYVLELGQGTPVYRVFGIYPPEGETKVIANINDAPPAYIHSLFHTEKHIISVVWQADFVKRATNIVESIGAWDPDSKTLFYIVDPAKGGVVAKYESEDAFFAFHEINSFENDDGDIFVNLPTIKDHSFLQAAKIENLRANLMHKGSSKNDLAGQFTRYRLPYHSDKGKKSHVAELDFSLDVQFELPRINEAHMGKPYRYAYGMHAVKPGYLSDSIIKIDTETKKTKVWVPKKNHLPSESIFVARPGGKSEDNGVLLTVTMDTSVKLSSMVVFEAKTMKEIGRARMPVAMGYEFHGILI